MYSAIKQGGQKLYEKARRGEVVDRPARPVTIQELLITDWAFPYLTLRVACSAGTYIRSLAHDLGQGLGVGAHLAGLRRLASWPFRVEDAVPLDDLRQAMTVGDWGRHLLPPDLALSDLPRLDADAGQSLALRQGKTLALPDEPGAAGLVRVYDTAGSFFALIEPQPARRGHWKPLKVFS
jgi:tRNA pseudouridine55 synthase